MKQKLLKKQKEWVELLKKQIRPETKKKKFGQHTSYLVDAHDKNFCCLGVCERFVVGRSFVDVAGDRNRLYPDTVRSFKFRDSMGKFKRPNKLELSKIEKHHGSLFIEISTGTKSLAGLNDSGISFETIAWFVEKFPHLVFKK